MSEQQTERPEGYNGWANYPTWAINLWLSNDEVLYNATRETVRLTVTTATATDYWTLAEARRYNVADALKDFVEELAGDAYSEASFVSDLFGYALGEVDWHEIADAWLED